MNTVTSLTRPLKRTGEVRLKLAYAVAFTARTLPDRFGFDDDLSVVSAIVDFTRFFSHIYNK